MDKKNLYQKLVEVRKSVKYLQKTTDGYKFKYVSEGQLLAALKEKMDEEYLWVDMEVVSLEPVECHIILDKQVRAMPGLRAVYEFTWTDADNPTDQLKRKVIVQDTESAIKTCGGLMTYGNKYFLLKFFNIPTDKLDPDAFENSLDKIVADEEKEDSSPKIETPLNGSVSSVLTPARKKYLKDISSQVEKVDPPYVKTVLNAIGVPSFENMDNTQADRAIRAFSKRLYAKQVEEQLAESVGGAR